jgi:hypothetical protein
VLALLGCKKESAPPAPTASADALPADLFVTTAPADAVEVVAASNSAKDGQPVVVKGRIAGAKDPIAANRAILTLADATLQTCDRIPGDSCATPWDACCEPSEVIAGKIVSVQVVGEDGRPLKATLAGESGLKPLQEIVVTGTMRVPQGSTTPVVEAKQIYVQR